MLAALVLAALAPAQDVRIVDLYRGAQVAAAGQAAAFRYWAAEDTFLDSKTPEEPQGGMLGLAGGPGRTILIKFGDLHRVVGPGNRIRSATLILSQDMGDRPELRSVGRVLQPWGEGPMRTIGMIGTKVANVPWSANWRHRRSGPDPIPWQQAGAQGAGDVRPFPDARMVQGPDGELRIEGIGPLVQDWLERWYDNHGIALSFVNSIEFFSNEARSGRPRLRLEIEPSQPATGADLSVVFIERTPEYERYGNVDAYTYKEQDGHKAGIMDQPQAADSKKWPADNETLTYTAHVKNVGDAPSQGFSATWVVRERSGAGVEHRQTIQPGETVTVTLTRPYRNIHTDHRVQPLALRIDPLGSDAVAANNFLEIQESALNIGVWVEQSFYERFSKELNLVGSRSFEDWVQEQVRIVNNVYMAQSRYSFAPEGSLERVRVQRIRIVPDGYTPEGQNLFYDAELPFAGGATEEARSKAEARIESLRFGLDLDMLRLLSAQLGLIDLDVMNVPASGPGGEGGKVRLRHQGQVVSRGMVDRFPGVMGGGDTRFEGLLIGHFTLPYAANHHPMLDVTPLEGTDLYSMTHVAALNSNLGKRRGYRGEFLYDMPSTVMIRALDFAGNPIANAELSFFQMTNGVIPDAPPTFTVVTGGNGIVSLPNRPILEPAPFTTLTGHTLRPNPFGRIDPRGTNGVFLVRAIQHGVTEWSWLKAWQLVDTSHRGGRAAPMFDIRFNLGNLPIERETNLASERILTDGAGTSSATLAGLVDGNTQEPVQFPIGADWIEIDLGRDRLIGEVRLLSRDGEFWPQFDVLLYGTGQTPNAARSWVREVDWRWTAQNRRDLDPKDQELISVAYRAPAQRARFIRLVRREPGPARLVEIQVFGASAAD
jgi:hypothetical protein